MPRFNPFSYLPSRNAIMGSLLYAVILIVKFGFILYDNELPGRQCNQETNFCEDEEVIHHPSTVDVPKSPTPKDAALGTVRNGVTYSHHVLFGRAVSCGEKQTIAEQKTLSDASTQNVASGSLSDTSRSGTQIGKNTIDIPSSPTTLVNTPTDHASPVTAANDDEEQQLRAENAQLKSSIVALAKVLSQEEKKIAAAEERVTAAEGRTTAAEGRAAAAEGRVTVVAGRATNLGTQIERLGEGLGTQVNRAANAEADLMRVRLQMWETQRDSLPSDDEVSLEQDQPSNDIENTQEENSGVSVPVDAQQHAEDHETREAPIEEAEGDFQDVTEDVAAAGLTTLAQEALLSAEMAAHQQTREELTQLKEEMGRQNVLLEGYRSLSEDATENYDQLWGEKNDLQLQFDEADVRISELEVSNQRLRLQVAPLQRQVEDLTAQATGLFNMLVQRDDLIRKGSKELKFFIRLGTELHARVKKAEKMLKGALGRADGLMRLAELRLPIHFPGETYIGDIIDDAVGNNTEIEPKVQLAIEGPPADSSGVQKTEIVSEQEAASGDADIERLVSDMFEMQDGTAGDNSNVADTEAEGSTSNNSDSLNTEDMASPGVPTATSEDVPEESGFTFSLEAPAQEPRQETESAAKTPGFAFGGTLTPSFQQEANGTATKPVFQFSATHIQETRQEGPSEVTKTPPGFNLPQQTAVPDVSGVQAVKEPLEEQADWIDAENEDNKDGENDQNDAAGLILGNHEVNRDDASAASANQSDTPDAEGNAQDFKFGATSRLFGAQKNPDPVPSINADSSSFNFVSVTDFNFGATTTFKAGSSPLTARSKEFEVADEDEREEGRAKRTKSASMFEAATSTATSPSSSDTKESGSKKARTTTVFEAAASINLSSPSPRSKEEATKKAKTSSIFADAASVNLSTPPFDNKAALGASFEHDPKGASGIPKFGFTDGIEFSASAAKGEEKKQEPASKNETTSMFVAGTSNQFSFSPSGVMPRFGGFSNDPAGASNPSPDPKPVEADGKDNQKQVSTKKAANAPVFTQEAFAKINSPASSEKAKFEDVQRAIDMSFENAHTATARQEPTYIYPAEYEDGLGARRPDASVEDRGGIPRGLDGCPDPNYNTDSLYDIEDGYKAPTKERAKVEQGEVEPASAMDFADANEGEVASFEPTQGSFGTTQTQLPDLSVSSDSLEPVQSAHTAAGGIQYAVNHQRSGDRPSRDSGEKIEVDEQQEVTGTPNAEASRTGSTSPSTSDGRVEGKLVDVLGRRGFDVTALARIVSSVTPAVQENLGDAGEDISQGPSRTAAEIVASWETECRERVASTLADGGNGQEPWRAPEWPASLPPLTVAPMAAASMHQPPASTQAAMNKLGGIYGSGLTASPEICEGAAHMVDTAPLMVRNADGRSNLLEVGAIEEGIRDAMGAMERLYIGPPTPPAVMQDFDPEIHFLSGDWIARRYSIRRTMNRQVGDIEEVEAECEPLIRNEEAREAEVMGETEEQREEREIAREPEDELRAMESPALCLPEIGNEEVFQTRAAEEEVARETEPQETDLATGSNDGVEMRMRPQMGLQMEYTANPETQASGSIAETGGESREQAEQANGTAPQMPPGGYRIWNLRKKR